MIKDYVIEVTDKAAFQIELDADATEFSRDILDAQGDPTGARVLAIAAAGIVPEVGIKQVNIVRMDDGAPKTWWNNFTNTAILGEATVQFIKTIADITWEIGGEAEYHLIHDQTPIPNPPDPDIIPSLLHCVIAS